MLSASGAPAQILRAWREGAFDLIVSGQLLDELGRALAYPKLVKRLDPEDASTLVAWLAAEALHIDDPGTYRLSVHSRERDDDYLLALAAAADSVLVTGDSDLLELGRDLPIYMPATFVSSLIEGGVSPSARWTP